MMAVALLVAGLAAGLSLTMICAWATALRTGRSGWIDAIWSFAIGVAGVLAALAPLRPGETQTARQIVVAVLAAIWSLRLGLHIVKRTASGGDDPRYAKLREEWGAAYRGRLLLFLQIQAAAAFLLALSILVAARNPAPGIRLTDWLGVSLLMVAIAGEGVADRQLTRFRAAAANRGGVCDIGLWSVSRHPNYFFQWVGWLAYTVIAIDPTGGYAWGWVALSGPALMYWLLVYASGIPPLEAHMLRSRGDAFHAYQARVNAFWPGPPRPARHAEAS
jgi:steroid 5-alpha reductase family enzyme